MESLIGGLEVLGGATSTAAGVFLTWYYQGSPSTAKHVILIPITALFLIVVGLGVLGRGIGII